MEITIETEDVSITGKKIIASCTNRVGIPRTAGWAYFYPLINSNGLYERAGYIEDVFVNERFRGNGIGEELVKAVIRKAQFIDKDYDGDVISACSKLVGTTRSQELVKWYEHMGFSQHGYSFRMDFPKGS